MGLINFMRLSSGEQTKDPPLDSGWEEAVGETVFPIDSIWERVVAVDAISENADAVRFGRVRVELR